MSSENRLALFALLGEDFYLTGWGEKPGICKSVINTWGLRLGLAQEMESISEHAVSIPGSGQNQEIQNTLEVGSVTDEPRDMG